MRKLFFILLLAPSLAEASAPSPARTLQEKAHALGLAEDRRWLRLLHCRRGLFGPLSQADGPAFFLSPRGRRDPAAELDADLAAFFDPPPADPEKQSPQCRFPARYRWLREKLGEDPSFPAEQACPRLDKWLSRMDPGGLTLLYASSYMNNPASMYGHTFLRIDPSGARAATPILAYTINFAAETKDTNGLVFAVKGLLGGYPGQFSTHPFYAKVQEYTNMESRDLWEYRLDIPSSATRGLLLHLWEMGGTWFDYYFFTENCSYQLLPLLEAVDPDLDLSRRFRFKAIPVDTLRAVQSAPGFITGSSLRPSVMRMVLARRALLTPDELGAAEAAARRPIDADKPAASFPPERRALVLDSAYDLVRFRHKFARYPTPSQETEEQAILEKRGRIPVLSPDVSAAARDGVSPPEAGHRTGRIGLGGGRSAGGGFAEVSLRAAMHDVEEDPAGYVPGSRLEMIHPRFRYYDRLHRLSLYRFTAVDILSLSPLDRWVRYPSWNVSFGLDTPLDRPAAPGRGLLLRFTGGSGPSLGSQRAMVYGFAGMDAGAGGTLRDNYRLGWTADAGVLARPVQIIGLHAGVFRRRYFLGEPKTVDGARCVLSARLGERWETRFSAAREGKRKEGRWMLQFYL